MRKKKNAHRILVGKRKGKRPLGSPSHRRENYTKMKLEERGWDAWSEFNRHGVRAKSGSL